MKLNKRCQTSEEMILWLVRIIVVVLGFFSFYSYIQTLFNSPIYISRVKEKYMVARLLSVRGIGCEDETKLPIEDCIDLEKLKEFEKRFSSLFDPNFNSFFIVLIYEDNIERYILNENHFLNFYPQTITKRVDYDTYKTSKYVWFRKDNVYYLAKMHILYLYLRE
ncbi:MAG: hypothetical protein QXD62_03470 [Candidatus Woesearchaeota archaeon]